MHNLEIVEFLYKILQMSTAAGVILGCVKILNQKKTRIRRKQLSKE